MFYLNADVVITYRHNNDQKPSRRPVSNVVRITVVLWYGVFTIHKSVIGCVRSFVF